MTEKSEQEIIEEIMKDSFQGCNGIMKPECKLNYRTMRKCGDAFYCVNCMYHSIEKALQKGKELERDRQLLEGHEACNLAVVDKIGLIKEQASKIEELEKEYLHALECMDRICKRCQDNLERLRR